MTRNVLVTLVRSDMRLHDHPIFSQCAAGDSKATSALKDVTHVLPVYVFDQQFIEVGGIDGIQKGAGAGSDSQGGARSRVGGFWRCGAHRTRYITESVYDLKERLRKVGSDLSLFAGQSHAVLPKVVKALQDNGDHVHGVWLCKEPYTEEITQEQRIRKALEPSQTQVKAFHHRSLIHPHDLPFPIKELPDVFTQFRKRVEAPDMYREPLPAPDKMKPVPDIPAIEASAGVLALKQDQAILLKELLAPIEEANDVLRAPEGKDVDAAKLSVVPFKGGETEALKRLDHYFNGGKDAPAATYKETRNGMLGSDYSTKFSAALSHGLLSPRLIAQHAEKIDKDNNAAERKGGGYWINFELLWRDYFYFVSCKYGSKLYTLAGIEEEMDSKTAQQKQTEWKSPKSLSDTSDPFVRWAQYQTGVPLIDANMKELALTGYMSNRGRQNVASLLTKDLYYDWRLGAEWFESQLVDHDPASNYGNWQYVAGVGNDPRSSRQFNPIKQGKDYDKNADYIKTWLPALASLPANDAHHPWTTDKVPDGYPKKPVTENPAWKSHYNGEGGPRRGGIRGGGGGGGGGGRGGKSRKRGGGSWSNRGRGREKWADSKKQDA